MSKRRRNVIALTTLASALALSVGAAGAFPAGGNAQPKKGAASGQTLHGTWTTTVTLQNPPPNLAPTFHALDTFTSSGELLVSSSVAMPSGRGLAQGEWVRTGNRRFACTFVWFRFDPTGAFISTQRVRRTMTLAPGLESFQGADAIDAIDPAGNVLGTIHGTETGTLIKG